MMMTAENRAEARAAATRRERSGGGRGIAARRG